MRFATVAGALCAVLSLTDARAARVSAEPASKMTGAMTMMKTPLTVPLNAQNGSGESGTATLRDTAKGLVVALSLKNGTGLQAAHIHPGGCAAPNPKPAFALHTVMNGRSTTTIPKVTIGELLGKNSINVHKSTSDFAYVSCGAIAKK